MTDQPTAHPPTTAESRVGDVTPDGTEPGAPLPVLRITCEDLLTGDKQSTEIPAGEYVLLTTEPCHVAHTQAFPAKGTHVVTIKGRTAR